MGTVWPIYRYPRSVKGACGHAQAPIEPIDTAILARTALPATSGPIDGRSARASGQPVATSPSRCSGAGTSRSRRASTIRVNGSRMSLKTSMLTRKPRKMKSTPRNSPR